MIGETVALTYAELAEKLGIEVASAKMRARRGRWTRDPGNDGKTRVQVPVEVLDEAPPPSPLELAAPPPSAPPLDAAVLTALRDAHTAEITRMEMAHKAAMDAVCDAHSAEIVRMEATRERDREAHKAEIEHIHASHTAEVTRLMVAMQMHPVRRAREHIEVARRWLTDVVARGRDKSGR